eukprot:7044370-Karenia_brevis.AAC.1
MAEYRHQGHATGNAEWEEQNTHQAQGISSSGKKPAAATGQPHIICAHFHSRSVEAGQVWSQ